MRQYPHFALNGLYETHPDLAQIMVEVLGKLDAITEVLDKIIEAQSAEQNNPLSMVKGAWVKIVAIIILAPVSGVSLKEAIQLLL